MLPAKELARATRSTVRRASMWRSRNSRLKRSRRRTCSSLRVILRSAVAFSRRSRRSWRVSRLWRDQHPAHPAGGDLHAPQHQLLGNPQGTVAGMPQAVVEDGLLDLGRRSEEHTSELQSLMRISYAVFCLKKKTKHTQNTPVPRSV